MYRKFGQLLASTCRRVSLLMAALGLAVQAQTAYAAPEPVSNINTLALTHGKMFLAPTSPLVVETPEAQIQVEPGAKVLVYKSKTELSVYNLCDHHRNQVKVVIGGQHLALCPAQQILLTSRRIGNFDQINPPTSIAYRKVREVALTNGLRLFDCDFSIPSALMNLAPLRDLGKSGNEHERNLHDEIVKTAAIIACLKRGDGAYRVIQRPKTPQESSGTLAMRN